MEYPSEPYTLSLYQKHFIVGPALQSPHDRPKDMNKDSPARPDDSDHTGESFYMLLSSFRPGS